MFNHNPESLSGSKHRIFVIVIQLLATVVVTQNLFLAGNITGTDHDSAFTGI